MMKNWQRKSSGLIVRTLISTGLFSYLLLFSFCTRERSLVVLQTSDLHGMFFPTDFTTGKEVPSSLAGIATLIRQHRESSEVLLLDNGDVLQGQPVVYYSNFVDTASTHLVPRMLNYLGYDAVTIGNHDIEAGPSVYDRLIRESRFPWLGANVVRENDSSPWFLPYVVFRKAGLKIAVIGLTTPSVPQWLPHRLWAGMQFRDLTEAAEYWIQKVQAEEEPDLVIGLVHSGLGDGGVCPGEENAVYSIATKIPGFDLILFGHDHRPENSQVVNNKGDTVYLLNPGSHARYLAVASIQVNSRNKKKFSIRTELKETAGVEPDEDFMKEYEADIQRTWVYVNQPLGMITEPLYSRDDLFGPGSFTGLVHRVQMDLTGADLSFAAPLSFNTTIPAGEIRVGDLFSLYRYENFLYTMELSGREVKDYLEYSCSQWFNTMTREGDYLLSYRLDSEGNPVVSDRNGAPILLNPSYNFDSARGIRYTVDVSQLPGKRISILGFQDGRAFSADSTYTVAINSYRGSGGGGHLERGAGIPGDSIPNRIISATSRDLRYLMMDWFRENSPVSPTKERNWKLEPERWVDEAMSRERVWLFGDSYGLEYQSN